MAAVAAAGAAVVLYFYSQRSNRNTLCGFGGGERQALRSFGANPARFRDAHQAPSTWLEALYFFAEALRYMYGETLGRWRTADLLIGLVYLARKEREEHPVADIAKQGALIGSRTGLDKEQVLEEMREMERDREMQTIALAIRGTHSLKDIFTSLTGASKPHHMIDASGVVLGYSHFGMLAAARWVVSQTLQQLKDALQNNPGYRLKVIGHSLGGGTAALFTMIVRDLAPEFAEATCLAIACPACMTLELAHSCRGYVTTIVHGCDIIPTISPGNADVLREEVIASAWYEAFRNDMRSSVIVRAVESSLDRMTSATTAATSWTSDRLASASQSFRSCVAQRPKRDRYQQVDGDDSPTAHLTSPTADEASRAIEVASQWAEAAPEPRAQPSTESGLREPMRSRSPQQRRQADSSLASTSAPAEHDDSSRAGTAADSSVPASKNLTRWSLDSLRASGEASKNLYRNAGSLLYGAWFKECRSAPPAPINIPSTDNDSSLDPGEGGDPLSPIRSPAQVEMGSEGGSEDEGGMGEPSREALPTPQELFRDMHAVQVAVEAAEEAEAQGLMQPWTQTPRPGVFVGLASQRDGSGTASTSAAPADRGHISDSSTGEEPDEKEEQWKRCVFPAGRILHLVPIGLVPGMEKLAAASASSSAPADPPHNSPSGRSPSPSKESTVRFRPRQGDQSTISSPMFPEDDELAPTVVVGTKLGAKKSSGYQYGDTSAAATTALVTEAVATGGTLSSNRRANQALAAVRAEKYLLLENVPQEAYGRVRLCSTMISHHFIPSYLAALESAVQTYVESVESAL
ncbi:hypothetical protein WJX73_006410 [Symbiochloris irregularis]|uniref:Fungal lipase-type domain-containing protein n=1 Tax=Symbiochloris irregularis TaxID=706552 RepID=A0AAW1NQD9_9CHLO